MPSEDEKRLKRCLTDGDYESFQLNYKKLDRTEKRRFLAHYRLEFDVQFCKAGNLLVEEHLNIHANELNILVDLIISEEYELSKRIVQDLEASTKRLASSFYGTLFTLTDLCCSRVGAPSEQQISARYDTLREAAPKFFALLVAHERNGFLPWEYAAWRRRYYLSTSYLCTPGHLLRRQRFGKWTLETVNMAQYNWNGDRFLKSPIMLYADEIFNSKKERLKPEQMHFYNNYVIKEWAHQLKQITQRQFNLKVPAVGVPLLWIAFYLLLVPSLMTKIYTAGSFTGATKLRLENYATGGNATNEANWIASENFLQSMCIINKVRYIMQFVLLFFAILALTVKLHYAFQLPPDRRQLARKLFELVMSKILMSKKLYDWCYFHAILDIVVLIIWEFAFLPRMIPKPQLTGNNGTAVNEKQLVMANYYILMITVFLLTSILMTAAIMTAVQMSIRSRVFLYLVYSFKNSAVVVYTLLLPMILFTVMVYFALPYEGFANKYPTSSLHGYAIAVYRLYFSVNIISETGLIVLSLAQAFFYFFICVFLLNFTVALLSLNIAAISQTAKERQTMLAVYFVHQFMALCHRFKGWPGPLYRLLTDFPIVLRFVRCDCGLKNRVIPA